MANLTEEAFETFKKNLDLSDKTKSAKQNERYKEEQQQMVPYPPLPAVLGESQPIADDRALPRRIPRRNPSVAGDQQQLLIENHNTFHFGSTNTDQGIKEEEGTIPPSPPSPPSPPDAEGEGNDRGCEWWIFRLSRWRVMMSLLALLLASCLAGSHVRQHLTFFSNYLVRTSSHTSPTTLPLFEANPPSILDPDNPCSHSNGYPSDLPPPDDTTPNDTFSLLQSMVSEWESMITWSELCTHDLFDKPYLLSSLPPATSSSSSPFALIAELVSHATAHHESVTNSISAIHLWRRTTLPCLRLSLQESHHLVSQALSLLSQSQSPTTRTWLPQQPLTIPPSSIALHKLLISLTTTYHTTTLSTLTTGLTHISSICAATHLCATSLLSISSELDRLATEIESTKAQDFKGRNLVGLLAGVQFKARDLAEEAWGWRRRACVVVEREMTGLVGRLEGEGREVRAEWVGVGSEGDIVRWYGGMLGGLLGVVREGEEVVGRLRGG